VVGNHIKKYTLPAKRRKSRVKKQYSGAMNQGKRKDTRSPERFAPIRRGPGGFKQLKKKIPEVKNAEWDGKNSSTSWWDNYELGKKLAQQKKRVDVCLK